MVQLFQKWVFKVKKKHKLDLFNKIVECVNDKLEINDTIVNDGNLN